MAAARLPSEEVALLINEPIEALPQRKISPDYGTRPKEAHYQPEEHRSDPLVLVQKSEGLTTAEAKELLKKYGKNQLPEKTVSKWYIFFSQLWQPMPVMIWIAAAVEIVLKNYMDAGILITINMANAFLSFYETTKAGDAVAALKASLKPTATCMRDGVWDPLFDARMLVPGDLVELSAGCAVPADCMINHGPIEIDESAMTCESLPVTLHERQLAKMAALWRAAKRWRLSSTRAKTLSLGRLQQCWAPLRLVTRISRSCSSKSS